MQYIQVLTFLEHVSVFPFDCHQVGNTSTSMGKYAMEEAWSNGMTKTRKKVNKQMYSVQMLCSCGFKSLLPD